MANETTDGALHPDARRDELVERFRSLEPDEARRQIAVLPYYHQLENEITKPNQGTFVTRYFQTKWRPALGSEASNIVLALRLLANQDGATFASQDTIASYAGISVRQLKRWLSQNEDAVGTRSPEWLAQWRVLHRHFLRSKSHRYLLRKDPHRGAVVKRTTSLYHVAMDDPVHPDDEPRLYVAAAERIVREEVAANETRQDSHKGPTGPNGKSITIDVDNQTHKGPTGPYVLGPNGPNRSYSYRLTSNVNNINRLGDQTAPPTEQDRERREALAHEIGEQLNRLAGDRDPELHKSLGLHRRIATHMPERLVREALAAVRDAADDERAGRRTLHRGYAAYFAGVIRKIADREKIDLGVEWSLPE